MAPLVSQKKMSSSLREMLCACEVQMAEVESGPREMYNNEESQGASFGLAMQT